MLELFIYIVFLIVLTSYSVESSVGNPGFYYTSRVADVIVHEEFPDIEVEKSFLDIGEREEFWQFMKGPFYNAFFGFEHGAGSNHSRVFDGDFVIDSIRVGQQRMKNVPLGSGGCHIPNWLRRVDSDAANAIQQRGCFPAYGSGHDVETGHFGHWNATGDFALVRDCFKASNDVPSQLQYRGSVYPLYYDTPVHTCGLNTSSAATHVAEQWIDTLSRSGWFDEATRAVSIETTLFAPDVNMFIYIRLLIEQPSTGGIVPSADIGAVTLTPGLRPGHYAKMMVSGVLLALLCAFFAVQELAEFCEVGCKKYFSNMWNVLEVFNLLLFLIYAMCIAVGYAVMEMGLQNGNQNRVDITSVTAWFKVSGHVLSLNTVVAVFKLFKYVQIDGRLSLIMDTFRRARSSLASILVILFIFLVGFALAFSHSFGDRLEQFRTFGTAFMTLFLAMLGEFPDAERLVELNVFVGPFLLLVFQAFVNFILLSLVFAVIEHSFEAAQEDLHSSDGPKDVIITNLKQRMRQLNGRIQHATTRLWSTLARRSRTTQSDVELGSTSARNPMLRSSLHGGGTKQTAVCIDNSSSSSDTDSTMTGVELRGSATADVSSRLNRLENKLDMLLARLSSGARDPR